MVIRGQEINHLLLFCCFFLLVSLPPSSHYPEGQAKTITPLSSLRHSVSGHYRPHLTDGDTKTWGKATPGLCPGVGPRADTCWSPVPFTPASLQPWRARWSLAASRAKHDRLCAETGKGEAREARGTAAGSSRRSSAPGRILSILHLSSRFIHIPRT